MSIKAVMRQLSAFALVMSMALAGPLRGHAEAPEATPPAYRLGASDKIRVIVFGEQDLSGEFVVSSGGSIAFPLIGDVPALGMTTPEFQESLRAKLAEGYLREPRVSVEVLTYRPFYILGEVQKPGEYPYSSGLTVPNAVATAGGYTYRADSKKVYIKRAKSLDEDRISLTPGQTIYVSPGDTIRVGERFF
jgi:polysaccharide export outer membrane protein